MPATLRRRTEVRTREYAEILGDAPPPFSPAAFGPPALTVVEYELAFLRRPCRLARPSPDGKTCLRCGRANHPIVWKGEPQ